MSGPPEDPLVCSDEPVALQGGGDNHAVGGISVHVPQQGRSSRDSPIDGDLHEAPIQKVAPPSLQIKLKVDPALLDSHTDFPEGYGRGRGVPFVERALNRVSSL